MFKPLVLDPLVVYKPLAVKSPAVPKLLGVPRLLIWLEPAILLELAYVS